MIGVIIVAYDNANVLGKHDRAQSKGSQKGGKASPACSNLRRDPGWGVYVKK